MKIRVSELRRLIREAMLREASGGRLVVVDVQPEYADKIGFDVGDLLRTAATDYSSVLFLWNGPDLGMCSKDELKGYYFEALDYDDEVVEKLFSVAEFYDKGYGFFRDLMDHPCFRPADVEKIVKYMIENDVRDIRDLKPEDIEAIGVSELLADELENYGFFIPDLKDVLPVWNGSDLAGGSVDECLAEVELLASAMGLSLNRLGKFTY
jgi:hypothetical protein